MRKLKILVPIEERFARIGWDVDGGGCWLWRGAVAGGRYGMIAAADRGRVPEYAHRVSWRIHCGPIPDGVSVLHRCDVRRCVNPDHLFLGDHIDNMVDMARKKRAGGQKLTIENVEAIRASAESGVVLGARYGVSRSLISKIRLRRWWKHV